MCKTFPETRLLKWLAISVIDGNVENKRILDYNNDNYINKNVSQNCKFIEKNNKICFV